MWVKTRRSDTPMTISGVTNGKSMMKLEVPEPRPRQRARPMASSTPIGTAMRTSAPASLKLWTRECRRVGSCQTESTGSPQYQRVEKASQTVRERVALKENSTAIATGTIDHTMYAQVKTTRKRGFLHGLRSQPRKRVEVEGCGLAGCSATAVTAPPPSRPRVGRDGCAAGSRASGSGGGRQARS